MAQTKTRSATVPAILIAACLIVGGVPLSTLQGCRPLEEGTDSASRSAQRDSGRAQLHGCWKLNLRAEGPQLDSLRAWLPAGSLPSIVELDTARAEPTGRDSIYKAYSWFDGRREPRPFSVWRRLGPDSVRIQRAGALAGTMLQLHAVEGRLVGNVVVYGDAGMRGEPGRRKGTLEATSVQCPRK